MKLKYRLQRLTAKLPPPDRTEAQKRWEDVQDRFCRLRGQAEDLFSPEEEDAVEQGFRPLTEGRALEGPNGRWLRDLRDGCCRLPKLPAAVMKALLLAWLTPVVTGGVTCKGCGLEYPHQDHRPLLAVCPAGCASPEWDWSHLVRDYDRAWKSLAGYAGDPRHADADLRVGRRRLP